MSDPNGFFNFRSCFGEVLDSHVENLSFDGVTRLVGRWRSKPTEMASIFISQL